jgi:hypothetical protein
MLVENAGSGADFSGLTIRPSVAAAFSSNPGDDGSTTSHAARFTRCFNKIKWLQDWLEWLFPEC